MSNKNKKDYLFWNYWDIEFKKLNLYFYELV